MLKNYCKKDSVFRKSKNRERASVCGNGDESRRCNPGSVAAKRDEILAKVLVTAMTHKLAVLWGPRGEIEKRRGKL